MAKIVTQTEEHLARLAAIEARYADDPAQAAAAEMKEIIRAYAEQVGVCADCVARFPDPLA